MFNFSKLPQSAKCQGGRHQHCQRPQSVFEEDETEEATEKKIKKIKNQKKEQQQNQTNYFFFNFSKLPPKRCTMGRRLHPQRPQSVFKSSSSYVGWGKQNPFYSTATGRLGFQVDF